MAKVISSQFLGDGVICDWCGDDYTESEAMGGITFGSKALCPKCAIKCEKDAKAFGEEHFIKHRCPPGKTFAEWVQKDLRGGKPASIEIVEL